ncbi:carbon-nitrogen hydrolase family protein [Bacteroidota bacterium]
MSLTKKILVISLFLFSCTLKNEEGQKPEGVPNSDLENWVFETQREEIAPNHFIDKSILFENSPTLALAGDGKSYSNGQWFKYVEAKKGKYYKVKVYYRGENVEEPKRCILAQVLWQDPNGNVVGKAEYPRISRSENKSNKDWELMEQTYLVPDEASKARLELIYRWDEDGKVNFGGVSFEETQKPESRMVRLATIHYRPQNGKSAQDNLDQFVPYIEEAALERADIVCLPEGTTMAGTDMDYITASEPVPGPSTNFLGKLAAQHKMYIIAGILEKDGPVVYNVAVLINRNGELAGKYRKTSLPREEIKGGITPGDALPVFDTDFGRIGMMICWDSTFPEQARTLSMKGAEVIFLPIWGGYLTLVRARAIENQVYLVSSTYDMKSAVFGLEGEIIDEATDEDPVVVVEVDLNQQKLWPWVGDLKNRIPREMPAREALKLEGVK